MVGALALVLLSAVGVQVEQASGLDVSERDALAAETSRAIDVVTGSPASTASAVTLSLKARRVGWRIRLAIERKDRGGVSQRTDLDLTRDRSSWSAPLLDAVRALLPEGRALGGRERVAPAAAAPLNKPHKGAPPRAQPAPLVRQPAPDLQAVTAPTPEPDLTIEAPAPREGSKVLPWIVVSGSVVAGIVGANFALQAASAMDDVSTLSQAPIPDFKAIDEKQQQVFTGALLGSIFLSAAVSGLVTGTVLLID